MATIEMIETFRKEKNLNNGAVQEDYGSDVAYMDDLELFGVAICLKV